MVGAPKPSRRQVIGGAVALAVASVWPRSSRADELTGNETHRLLAGESVRRPLTFDRGGRHYIGGVSYTLVQASPEELLALLDDPEAIREILPRTKYAVRLPSRDDTLRIELHQGNALVDASYTLWFVREAQARRVRFWLDPRRPHSLDDAWGFFRYEPLGGGDGRLLLAYGALVDLGDALLRRLYEDRVRHAMLDVPRRVREYLEDPRRTATAANLPLLR